MDHKLSVDQSVLEKQESKDSCDIIPKPYLNHSVSIKTEDDTLVSALIKPGCNSTGPIEKSQMKRRDNTYLAIQKIRPKSLQRAFKNLFSRAHRSSEGLKETRQAAPLANSPHEEIQVELVQNAGKQLIKAYPHVDGFLANHEGYPKEEIAQLQHPLLQEQMVDLYYLSQEKVPELFPKILTAAKKAQNSNDHDFTEQDYILSPSCEFLAKMIYLIDKNCHIEFDSDSPVKFFMHIQDQFEEQLKASFGNLLKLYRRYERTHIQKPEQGVEGHIPQFIAEMLITQAGSLNTGLINPLIHAYSENSDLKFCHFAKALKRAQAVLVNKPQLRGLIREIKKPSEDNLTGKAIIYSTMKIPLKTPLRDSDAQRCALAGYLSYVRQSMDTGSCFADFLMIDTMLSKPEMCIQDFTALLENGALKRKVEKSDEYFQPHVKGILTKQRKRVKLDAEGYLYEGNLRLAHIWQEPGFREICQIIGVEDIRTFFLRFIRSLCERNEAIEGKYILSVDEILSELAKTVKNSPYFLPEMLYLAFHSEKNPPLLSAWENTIASMSQSSYLLNTKKILLNSIQGTLMSSSRMLPLLLEEQYKKLFETVHDQIHQRIQIVFSRSLDSQSQSGFILMDTQGSKDQSKWNPIATPQQLTEFIESVLANCLADQEENQLLLDEFRELKIAKTASESTIQSYCTSHQDDLSPLGSYCRTKSVPFINTSGANALETYKVYHELSNQYEIIKIQPTTTEELLYSLISTARELKLPVESNKVPVRIPRLHAFLFTPKHPSFIRAADGLDHNKERFIEELFRVSNLISEQKPTDALLQMIIDETSDILKFESQKPLFIQQCQDLPRDTLHHFRQGILDLFSEITSADPQRMHMTELRLDRIIISHLPQQSKMALADSAIHFADTNWEREGTDLHLCFLVNPGSKRLELFEISEDNKHLKPMDSDIWFNGREWHLFPQDHLAKEVARYARA